MIVFFAYLLLAMPLLGSVRATISALEGEAVVSMRLAGLTLEHDSSLAVGENGWPFSTAPIWGAPQKKENTGKRTQLLRRHIEHVIRQTAQIKSIDVSMRIGLDEAWSTALAAGGARAAVFSALSILPAARNAAVCVIPDFFAPCFSVRLRCIFSVTIGDIVLRAAKLSIIRAAGKGVSHAAASH